MPGPFTLGQIVSRLGGRVAGDPQVRIRQVGALASAGAGCISFFSSRKLTAMLAVTRAAAVIVAPKDEAATPLPRIVTVGSLDISADKNGKLSMAAVAKTYRYLEAEELHIKKKESDKTKAKPGVKAWGALSVFLQMSADVSLVRKINRD